MYQPDMPFICEGFLLDFIMDIYCYWVIYLYLTGTLPANKSLVLSIIRI